MCAWVVVAAAQPEVDVSVNASKLPPNASVRHDCAGFDPATLSYDDGTHICSPLYWHRHPQMWALAHWYAGTGVTSEFAVRFAAWFGYGEVLRATDEWPLSRAQQGQVRRAVRATTEGYVYNFQARLLRLTQRAGGQVERRAAIIGRDGQLLTGATTRATSAEFDEYWDRLQQAGLCDAAAAVSGAGHDGWFDYVEIADSSQRHMIALWARDDLDVFWSAIWEPFGRAPIGLRQSRSARARVLASDCEHPVYIEGGAGVADQRAAANRWFVMAFPEATGLRTLRVFCGQASKGLGETHRYQWWDAAGTEYAIYFRLTGYPGLGTE